MRTTATGWYFILKMGLQKKSYGKAHPEKTAGPKR